MVLADTHSTGGGVSGNVLILVPAGIRADICVYAFYRDKTIFASDAEKFVSSRWEHLGLDQWFYLSFGRGPRACLGGEKALLEARYIIIGLLKEFERVESKDEREYKKLTCRNGNSCKIAIFTG